MPSDTGILGICPDGVGLNGNHLTTALQMAVWEERKIHSSTPSLTHSYPHSLTHSLTHSHPRSLTHPHHLCQPFHPRQRLPYTHMMQPVPPHLPPRGLPHTVGYMCPQCPPHSLVSHQAIASYTTTSSIYKVITLCTDCVTWQWLVSSSIAEKATSTHRSAAAEYIDLTGLERKTPHYTKGALRISADENRVPKPT